MNRLIKIKNKLSKVFNDNQSQILAEVITDAYNELVKTSDFNELKGIVKDLAEAQKRTEIRVEELAEAQKRTEIRVEELAEAQKRTEIRVEELAEAQKRTEIKIGELADDIKTLTASFDTTRGELGGLSKSMSYAFENEAYRILPKILKEKYAIETEYKLIRAEIGGKEVNIFGKGVREGKKVIIVGEVKLRLDERRDHKDGQRDVFEELEEKVKAVTNEYGDVDIARVLITHYATKGFIKKAKEEGVIVVQSFEW